MDSKKWRSSMGRRKRWAAFPAAVVGMVVVTDSSLNLTKRNDMWAMVLVVVEQGMKKKLGSIFNGGGGGGQVKLETNGVSSVYLSRT